mmetsp:Transcript_54967/g.154197  ORF Transcript_54967/g.154197 Transcript_54967/m.154197 type:complete len:289 (+) Transcript_54967:35-901(+)
MPRFAGPPRGRPRQDKMSWSTIFGGDTEHIASSAALDVDAAKPTWPCLLHQDRGDQLRQFQTQESGALGAEVEPVGVPSALPCGGGDQVGRVDRGLGQRRALRPCLDELDQSLAGCLEGRAGGGLRGRRGRHGDGAHAEGVADAVQPSDVFHHGVRLGAAPEVVGPRHDDNEVGQRGGVGERPPQALGEEAAHVLDRRRIEVGDHLLCGVPAVAAYEHLDRGARSRRQRLRHRLAVGLVLPAPVMETDGEAVAIAQDPEGPCFAVSCSEGDRHRAHGRQGAAPAGAPL